MILIAILFLDACSEENRHVNVHVMLWSLRINRNNTTITRCVVKMFVWQ